MATLHLPIDEVYGVLLVFLRVAALVFTAPIFDSATIPVVLKAGLALAVSVLLFPVVDTMVNFTDLSLIGFVFGICAEIAIGITIGLSIKLLLAGIQLAGQIAGLQMGLAMANVMDPTSSSQIPLFAQFYNLMAMLIFLAVNAHHQFFRAIVDSYRVLPPLTFQMNDQLASLMMKLGADMFVLAIKVGAPLIAVLLLVSVGLGLVARTVPQMNIFVVAMPLKILIGLSFVMISAPFMTAFFIDLFSSYQGTMLQLLRTIALR
jgi:flagellar biosynthetic protein FliR